MSTTLDEIREMIKTYPVRKPVYTIGTDYSGDLTFRQQGAVTSPFINATEIQRLVDNCVQSDLVQNDDGTYLFVNKVEESARMVVDRVVQQLRDSLKKALPNQDPKRTLVYKWFSHYTPQSDDERKLMLLIFDYVENNIEVRNPDTKHAKNFVGLITHTWGKYGSRK